MFIQPVSHSGIVGCVSTEYTGFLCYAKQKKKLLGPIVRELTIPTERRHLSTKFSANFCG
jgi:hypothetical protein